MDAQYFKRIEQLYHEALERTGDERAAFLDQACAQDQVLRRHVESLLNQPAEGMLDRPAWQAAATSYAPSDDISTGSPT